MTNTNISSLFRQNGITKLYHFTDRANIQSIIDNGGLYSWKVCDNIGISINRPGGNITSRLLDQNRGLENYVRLSFTRNHPMMYVAQDDGRISDPVILEIDLSVVNLSTTMFSDRNAAKNGAIIQGGRDGALNINFQVVRQPDHFNLTLDEKEFYQAEILVWEKIPISCITNIDNYRPKPNPKPTTYTPIDRSSSIYKSTASSCRWTLIDSASIEVAAIKVTSGHYGLMLSGIVQGKRLSWPVSKYSVITVGDYGDQRVTFDIFEDVESNTIVQDSSISG